ncbi:MAG: hypothetical protein K2Q12_09765 [Rickettsiales bacterium]|nr:hypothetical protein [Rickettsiales bacterium]
MREPRANHYPSQRAGYSIVELAAVLSIIALVLGLSLSAGSMQIRVAEYQGTRDNLETIRTALDLYQSKYKRYPCPASLAATGAAYGLETAACDTACPAGLFCPGGNAVIGAVPFRALGIGDTVALDKWDNRIIYALDRVHATRSDTNNGTLSVVDAQGNEVTRSPAFGKAIYVLLSTGENEKGAVTKDGTNSFSACATSLDTENCNNSNGVFRDMPKNTGGLAASQFDDEILWKAQDWGDMASSDAALGTAHRTMVPAGAIDPQNNAPAKTRARNVSTYLQTSCAINAASKLYCWGRNTQGNIGDGTNVGPKDATSVGIAGGTSNISDWQDVTTYTNTVCGVRKNGVGYCWGTVDTSSYDNNGSLGIGISGNVTFSWPQQVANFTDWVKIVPSAATCGLRRNGQLYCWGNNATLAGGLFGNGSSTGVATTPVPIDGPTGPGDRFSDWANFSLWYHTCGVRLNGLGYCWGGTNSFSPTPGSGNSYGQLGNGTVSVAALRPTLVGGGITNWRDIRAGVYHTCGVTKNGRGFCWGRNDNGQLGDGSYTNRSLPTEVSGAQTSWSAIDVGLSATCGLRNGSAYCWGESASNQLGLTGTLATNYNTPQAVSGGITDFVGIDSRSTTHACGMRSDGSVWCWGNNDQRQLGNASITATNTPVRATTFVP